MAIKWKSWTALLPIKIISLLLIPLLVSASFCTALLAILGAGGDLELLVTNLADTQYFFDQQVYLPIYDISTILAYGDEKKIEEGRYLQIGQDADGQVYIYDTVTQSTYWYDLWSLDIDTVEIQQAVRRGIQRQLDTYRSSWKDLEEYAADGLQYYITDGETVFANTDYHQPDYFSSMPAYLLVEDGVITSKSHQNSRYSSYYYYYGVDSLPQLAGCKVYLAYDQSDILALSNNWKQWQKELAQTITLAAVYLLAALACFAVLAHGAGKRYGSAPGEIRFTLLDKPFLDIGAIALFVWVICIAVTGARLFDRYIDNYYYNNTLPTTSVRVLVTVCAYLAGLPALGWLLSLIKRIKAKGWWRHTLCYCLLSALGKFLHTLWAGIPMTLRGIVVTASLLVSAAVCVFAPPLLLLFGPVLLFFVLRFCRRLYLLEKGAALAAQGIGYSELTNLKGALGDIAHSVGDMSSGIQQAVDDKLKSERLKTELITNVSHDIRTPLTSLITYTDLLRDEGLESEKAPEYLEIIEQKAHRLKMLTDELFEAAKAASGNVEVHPEELDLTALVEQCLGELDEKVRQSGLEFRLNLPPHAPVYADGRLVWRIMENLLSNAFKYSLPHSRVYIDITPQGTEYRLEVKNISATPLNMDPSELTERFTRGDSARAGEGSGLGLSIVQSFAEALQGRFLLSIDGDLFKATIFLPAGTEQQPE